MMAAIPCPPSPQRRPQKDEQVSASRLGILRGDPARTSLARLEPAPCARMRLSQLETKSSV